MSSDKDTKIVPGAINGQVLDFSAEPSAGYGTILKRVATNLAEISKISRLVGRSELAFFDKETKYPKGVPHFQAKCEKILLERSGLIVRAFSDLIELSAKMSDKATKGGL